MIISFAWTTKALLARRKTVTRRSWSDAYARRMKRHAIEQGHLVDAYDRSPRSGGKKVATLRLTSIRKERLGLLLEDRAYGLREMELEGGDLFWDGLEDFVGTWKDDFDPEEEMYRVAFEIVSLVQLQLAL